MSYLKLFEAYSIEDYQKILSKVKKMIKDDKDKEEVMSFINKYSSDDAKELDNLRIILDRIGREYLNNKIYLAKSRRPFTKSEARYNKKFGYECSKDGKTPVYVCYYAITNGYKKMCDFLSSQKSQYDFIKKNLKNHNLDISKIDFIFEKLFEILDWVHDTNEEKHKINNNHNLSDEEKISAIEKLNYLDFENEVEEVDKLIKIGKNQIRRVINSI